MEYFFFRVNYGHRDKNKLKDTKLFHLFIFVLLVESYWVIKLGQLNFSMRIEIDFSYKITLPSNQYTRNFILTLNQYMISLIIFICHWIQGRTVGMNDFGYNKVILLSSSAKKRPLNGHNSLNIHTEKINKFVYAICRSFGNKVFGLEPTSRNY